MVEGISLFIFILIKHQVKMRIKLDKTKQFVCIFRIAKEIEQHITPSIDKSISNYIYILPNLMFFINKQMKLFF